MSNLIDYLHWRGDLTFQQSPFNEADNLVLSMLSYVELDGIVPDTSGNASITVNDACRAFFSRPHHTDRDIDNNKSLIHLTPYILRAMAGTNRYGEATLSKYINSIDSETAEQFSALHIGLSDGTEFIAFRGTDDTLIGWREDCNLSLGVVPAQTAAVDYLVRTTKGKKPRYRIGGQSKGGNLAVYASTQCPKEVQDRIIFVYNNDGPGFLPEVIQSEGYQSMLPRMHMYLPEESMIGMLFEHEESRTYVASTNEGLLQHDSMSWQILGAGFETKPKLSERAEMIDTVLAKWLKGLSTEERKIAIDALFTTLNASGDTTLEGIANGGLRSIMGMMSGMGNVDDAAKPIFKQLLNEFSQSLAKEHLPDFKKLFSSKRN